MVYKLIVFFTSKALAGSHILIEITFSIVIDELLGISNISNIIFLSTRFSALNLQNDNEKKLRAENLANKKILLDILHVPNNSSITIGNVISNKIFHAVIEEERSKAQE